MFFISSTYSDLIMERDKVTQAILELNHFPAGMEQFPAAGIPPIEVIKSYLKDCDYYVLIVAARYGSTYDDGSNKGKSFTEVEYDLATELGIPVIAFLHNDMKSIPSGKTDEDDVKREKLLKFRERVEKGNQTVKYWSNPDDLKAKVLSSIPSAIKYQDRTGWMRACSIKDNNATENNNLQNEINQLKVQMKEKEKSRNEAEISYKRTINDLKLELNKLKSIVSSRSEPDNLPKMQTYNVNGVEFRMIYVEGGTFMMGADINDCDAQEKERPIHKVTLSNFWIGETQVTQALWLAVVGKNPSKFIGDINLPVENVSWEDCNNFIIKLNNITGKTFRMPTEAQWEFAARGGTKSRGFIFSGSNVINDVSWYSLNSNNETHPVMSMIPNELGLYDMSGNVSEWCQDWYIQYPVSEQNNPTGRKNGGSFRVIRGGSWYHAAKNCRVTARTCSAPLIKYNYLGLRLVL